MANLLESDKSSRLGLRPRTSLSQPIGSNATLEPDVGIQQPTPLVESLLLSTLQVASHLSGIPFKPTESVNDIIYNIIESRDQGKLLVPTPDVSGGGPIKESKSLNSAKRLRENFNPISTTAVRVDPFLTFLLDNMSSSGPTSLRRGQNHRTTIHRTTIHARAGRPPRSEIICHNFIGKDT